MSAETPRPASQAPHAEPGAQHPSRSTQDLRAPVIEAAVSDRREGTSFDSAAARPAQDEGRGGRARPRGAALVTGSSRGIGLAIAVHLARAGFSIAVNTMEAGPELDEAVRRVEAEGATVVPIVADVSVLARHETMLDEAEAAIGPLTTLVNNAGVSVMHRGDVLDVTEASYDRCFAVNAKAPFFLTQAFARRLLARDRSDGRHYSIVTLTSANAEAVGVTRAEYCASKAAAAMISKVFAVRLADEGIQVFDVRPGLIETDMTRPAKETYERRIRDEGLTLIRRMGQPDDVARIVTTLATGGLPFTVGHVIAADAGLLVPRF